MADNRTRRRILSRVAGGAFAVVLVAGFVWFVHTMMTGKASKPQRQVQVIQVITPPPPPPEQPPPPPPPEKTEEPLPKDEPEPVPEEAQQAPQQALGVDAEGAAGGDAFGLAARKGGSDLIGGSGSAPFAWYTNRVKDAIQERLAATPCTRTTKGSLSIQVVMEADGRVRTIRLTTSTGDQKADRCIDSALTAITRISDPVPPGMPQQINLKIVSRI